MFFFLKLFLETKSNYITNTLYNNTKFFKDKISSKLLKSKPSPLSQKLSSKPPINYHLLIQK